MRRKRQKIPFTLTKQSSTPLHVQLTQKLVALAADLEDGTALPSERSLAEALKISRDTVRTSLQALVRQGLVERRCRGTVVARRRSCLTENLHLGFRGHHQ